jgi:hypothetical protein
LINIIEDYHYIIRQAADDIFINITLRQLTLDIIDRHYCHSFTYITLIIAIIIDIIDAIDSHYAITPLFSLLIIDIITDIDYAITPLLIIAISADMIFSHIIDTLSFH